MKTIEELCKEAFIDATGVYKNVSVKDWWQEFKMQNNIEQKSNDVGKQKIKLVKLDCMVCGKEFEGEEPKICCSGRDCGCMGLPIEPVVCSDECYNKFPFNQKSIDVGDVEKAAENHWHYSYVMAKSDDIKPYVIQDFKAGAEWQRQSSTTDVGDDIKNIAKRYGAETYNKKTFNELTTEQQVEAAQIAAAVIYGYRLKQKSIDVGEQEDELCNLLSWYQSKGDEYRERTLIVDCVKDFLTRKQ